MKGATMQNESFWDALVQWLHGVGVHVTPDVAQRVEQGAQAASNVASGALAQLDMSGLLALAAALGWASGLRLYAVVFAIGGAGALGWVALPPGLAMLTHPLVLTVSGCLLLVEFFADKVPWLDSLWDAVNAFLRVPGGALLAASVFGADDATMALVAGLMGGSLAAMSAATKMTARAAINTSPEPFSNVGASLAEDGLSMGALWLAVEHPLMFASALAVVLVLSVVLLVVLWRFFKGVLRRLRLLRGPPPQEAMEALPAQ